MLAFIATTLLVVLAAEGQAQPALRQLRARVAEEAASLEQNAPRTLSLETLEQRTLLPPSRFRPRVGAGALEPQALRLRVREVVSEFSVGALRQSPSASLLEFRQVVSVDGRKVQSTADARRALSLGIQSRDDRVRKRMLENFAKYGLVDIATDYALILLAFSSRGQQLMEISPAGEAMVGVDAALVLAWRQTSPAEGELEFIGRLAVRRPLEGLLYVRRSDGLPLRISAWAAHLDNRRQVRDEATVDYVMSSHGFLTPASVVHRHLVDGRLLTENRYSYEAFKLFSADAEIKFTEVPDPPKDR